VCVVRGVLDHSELLYGSHLVDCGGRQTLEYLVDPRVIHEVFAKRRVRENAYSVNCIADLGAVGAQLAGHDDVEFKRAQIQPLVAVDDDARYIRSGRGKP
jgi:hypothetical protein